MKGDDYVFWNTRVIENVCHLAELKGVERRWELSEGIPRAANFTGDATLSMDDRYPYNMLLADNLLNKNDLIVVSGRLKRFIETRAVPDVEYLPVTILDHKGRVAEKDYFVVHPVNPLDCLDLANSEPRWSAIDTTRIKELKKFVLDESRLDPRRKLFRPKGFNLVTLVSRDLAAEIDAEKFVGVQWLDLSRFADL